MNRDPFREPFSDRVLAVFLLPWTAAAVPMYLLYREVDRRWLNIGEEIRFWYGPDSGRRGAVVDGAVLAASFGTGLILRSNGVAQLFAVGLLGAGITRRIVTSLWSVTGPTIRGMLPLRYRRDGDHSPDIRARDVTSPQAQRNLNVDGPSSRSPMLDYLPRDLEMPPAKELN